MYTYKKRYVVINEEYLNKIKQIVELEKEGRKNKTDKILYLLVYLFNPIYLDNQMY